MNLSHTTFVICGLINQIIMCFADYIFSNEHINYIITYSFDFRNEELLSYYISFLRWVIGSIYHVIYSVYLTFVINCLCCSILLVSGRAISGKLNKNTISLLVKTEKV